MFAKNIKRVTLLTTNIKVAFTLLRQKSDQCLKDATKQVKKSVFISQSTDIHTNLALEQWFLQNIDFTHHHVLMLWRNDPCVVIGLHQNPWLEANVTELHNRGVKLARRNSGGGTVYHDLGNLNMTFFTPNKQYNRKYNLEIISRALFREWGLKVEITKRDDIVVRGDFKVSGTASKLTRTNSYHHCTLLVDVNKAALKNALLKKNLGIETKATKSTPAAILNLKDENKHVNINKLMSAVGWEYLRTPADQLIDGGLQYASQQNGFKYINPSEGWFPNLNKIRDEFRSWDWIYGKTPQFSSNIYLPIMVATNNVKQLKLAMNVEKGLINDITSHIPPGISTMGFHGDAQVYIPDAASLKGQKFSETSIELLRKLIPMHESKDTIGKVMVQSVN